MKTDNLIETLKEWVAVANPGLVTQQDMARVETRLDELEKLVDALEARLAQQKRPEP